MPQLTKEEFMALIKEIDSNTIPLTMNLSADKEEKALKECDDYLNKKIVDIRSISPLAVHFIISKLSSSEQIKFIRENIDEIYQNFSVFVLLGTGGIIWCVKWFYGGGPVVGGGEIRGYSTGSGPGE